MGLQFPRDTGRLVLYVSINQVMQPRYGLRCKPSGIFRLSQIRSRQPATRNSAEQTERKDYRDEAVQKNKLARLKPRHRKAYYFQTEKPFRN